MNTKIDMKGGKAKQFRRAASLLVLGLAAMGIASAAPPVQQAPTPGAPEVSAQEFSHAAVKSPAPTKQERILKPSSIPAGLRAKLRAGSTPLAQTGAIRANLTPVNTGTGVVFTCDSNVAAATCSYLNSTVAANLNGTFTNANANIYVLYGSTGLGSSTQYLNFVTYDQYVAALNANTNKSAIQKSALSALSTYDSGPYGSSNVEVTSALGANLGFTGLSGITTPAAGESACTPGTTGCYNVIVTVTNDPGTPLYYDNLGGTEPADAYDFYSVVAHEANEALGTSSCIHTNSAGTALADGCGTGVPSAVDLFRYSGAGALVLDATLDATPGQYFSYDGGNTNPGVGVGGSPLYYNTLANGDDYADYVSSVPCQANYAIQDAEGCPGFDHGRSILNDGGSEIKILSALGYDTPAAQTTQTITFNSIPSQVQGTKLALSASASSGLPVSFTSLTPTVCTVSGTTATLVSTGTCTIQASQAGNPQYAAATPVKQSFTVTPAADTTTTCKLTGTISGPPTQIQITMQDTGTGLKTIQLTSSSNATISIPSFTAGTKSPVVVTATKGNQSQSSDVAFKVTDEAGGSISCDPTVFTATTENGWEVHTFRNVSSSEHYIRLQNGDPGLRFVIFFINGKPFPEFALRNNSTHTLDVGSAMRQGSQNVIQMETLGRRGSSATILIGDSSVE